MSLPSREVIVRRLDDTLGAMVAETFGPVAVPDAEVKAELDALLSKGKYTVRDGMLTLLAMEVEHGDLIDWHEQGLYNPARSASRDLGSTIYPRLHIAGSPEALQTGVKGVSRYIDRKNATWKAILEWASEPAENGREGTDETPEETSHIAHIEAAFHYLAAGVAATARNLPDMPALDTPKLTFPTVFPLLDSMLQRNSAGAHEQFTFAALLEAWREQLGEPGVVETKNLNASDASAGTAADVQERHRGQVTEAYEVTANGYSTKVDQAERTLRRHDLRRVHIVAKDAAEASGVEIAGTLPADLDLTVLDVREEVRSILARLGKPHRRFALERLYALLVDKQPDDQLVQDFVSALAESGITVTP